MGCACESVKWHGRFTVAKFWADDDLTRATPYEVLEGDNLLLTAGASALWNRLAGLGAVTAFDASNGRLCVGNGTAAADGGGGTTVSIPAWSGRVARMTAAGPPAAAAAGRGKFVVRKTRRSRSGP